MTSQQNPDVNSYDPNMEPGEDPGASDISNDSGVEQNRPVPPDARPKAPIEEPPRGDDAPVGDVDDSPKRIA